MAGRFKRTRPGRARAGFTLIEVSLAIVMLIVALVAMTASNVRSQVLHRSTHERSQAHNALRAVAERIQSVSRAGVDSSLGWANYVRAAFTPGTGEIGVTFAVAGLVPLEGAATVGTIEVVLDETSTDATVGAALGLPRDLNGDGDAADASVGADARVIPIVLRARWRSPTGVQTMVHPFYVFGS